MTFPYDDSGTAILPTISLERITYLLLSSYLLIPSQLIKSSYGGNHYCTVLISKQRLAPTQSSMLSTVNKTSTPPLQDTLSRCVFSEYVNNDQYSFPSPVDIGLMMILTMTNVPTILIIILIILPMMLLMRPAVIGTHKEQDVLPDDMTINTVRQPTVLITIFMTVSPSSTFPYNKSGKRKKLCLQ